MSYLEAENKRTACIRKTSIPTPRTTLNGFRDKN